MAVTIVKKWHRVDNDNSQEIHFSNGAKFKVEKFYNEFEKHINEWQLLQFKEGHSSDGYWDWIDTYQTMSFAKEMAFYFGVPSD